MPPTITTQPDDQTAVAGTAVTLHVGASGATSYQWTRVLDLSQPPASVNVVNGTSYSGAQTDTLTLPNFGATQAGLYVCVVRNADGVTASRRVVVLLSGMVLPTITAQPANIRTPFGNAAHFSVGATIQDGALSYQWLVDGRPLTGPTVSDPQLTIVAALLTSAGWYQCRVIGAAYGVVLSEAASLVVTNNGTPLAAPYIPRPTGGIVFVGTVPPPSGGSSGTGFGSAGVGSGTASFAIMGGNLGPGCVYDGNYRAAQACGLPVPSFPFLDQGNTNAVVFRIPMEQALSAYAPLSMTDPIPGATNLYSFGDANFQDLGAGICRFDRLCGNIPAQRVRRGQSYTYPFQYVLTQGASITRGSTAGSIESYTGPSYSIGARAYPVDSTLIEDFFLDGQQANFPLRRAPSLEMIGQAVTPKGEDFDTPGTFPLVLSSDGLVVGANGVQYILAEDDHYDDYRGAVRRRVRRIIAAPTLASFRNSGT